MFGKNYHLHWIAGKADILSKYIIYIFLYVYTCFFPVISKSSSLLLKKFGTDFCCMVLLHLWALKVCLRFVKSDSKLETLILSSFLVSFFSRYVQLKSSFSDKKPSAVKSETLKLMWQSIKGKFDHWQKLELCKVIVQNNTENANGNQH